jgi:N6-adenosine-specific RNA methylase IME4
MITTTDLLTDLHGQTFRTIVADPPWRIDLTRKTTHKRSGQKNGREWAHKVVAQLDYQTMSDDEIAALRPPIADEAHLYLWTVNAKVESAYRVAREWGFRPASLLTWVKTPMGIGLGGTYCNTTEFCLFARRGTLKAQCRVDRTWWHWKRGRHSEKPEAFQDMVETVSPGPYLELFARRHRPNWVCWGDEVENEQVKRDSTAQGGTHEH